MTLSSRSKDKNSPRAAAPAARKTTQQAVSKSTGLTAGKSASKAGGTAKHAVAGKAVAMAMSKKAGSNAVSKIDGKLNNNTPQKVATFAKPAASAVKLIAKSAEKPVSKPAGKLAYSNSAKAEHGAAGKANGKAVPKAALQNVSVASVPVAIAKANGSKPDKAANSSAPPVRIEAVPAQSAAKPGPAEIKESVKPGLKLVVENPLPVKGKPGRPPGKKNAVVQAVDAPQARLEPAAEAPLVKPKGKPGRPPKNPKAVAGDPVKGKPGTAVAKAAGKLADSGDELGVDDQAGVFEEIDADAEIIPEEVEVVAVPAKTKRGNRAKEKALLKEFGGRPGLTEADREATRNKLKQLIKLGKERGFLTYAEINDHLPEDVIDAEAIESIITTFNDMGIAVYDQAPDAETLLMNDNTPIATSDEDAEEEAEAALSTVDSEFGRTTDPVRMYMREMGSVELLTREGEIEIAKRIEDGLKHMVTAISACPTTISEILANADKIRSGTMRIDEVVDGLIDPNAEEPDFRAVAAAAAAAEADFDDEGDEDGDPGGAASARLVELKRSR